MRSTYTFAVLDVSPTTYREIREKLEAAGYDHAFDGEIIDMRGIALREGGDAPVDPFLQLFEESEAFRTKVIDVLQRHMSGPNLKDVVRRDNWNDEDRC